MIAAHGGGRRWRSGHRRRHYVVAGQADAADAAVIVEDRIAATHLVGGREFEVVSVTVGQPSKRDGAGRAGQDLATPAGIGVVVRRHRVPGDGRSVVVAMVEGNGGRADPTGRNRLRRMWQPCGCHNVGRQ